MSIFLDQQELNELTGYVMPSKQTEWLSSRSWTFEISRLGKVKVLRKYAEMKLGIPVVVGSSPISHPKQSITYQTQKANFVR